MSIVPYDRFLFDAWQFQTPEDIFRRGPAVDKDMVIEEAGVVLSVSISSKSSLALNSFERWTMRILTIKLHRISMASPVQTRSSSSQARMNIILDRNFPRRIFVRFVTCCRKIFVGYGVRNLEGVPMSTLTGAMISTTTTTTTNERGSASSDIFVFDNSHIGEWESGVVDFFFDGTADYSVIFIIGFGFLESGLTSASMKTTTSGSALSDNLSIYFRFYTAAQVDEEGSTRRR
ncbi:hypothetical protein K435DRAFT_804947 [Dendrothele bispora CBS 962.96]|uniref:Uncharacterized protein n=1 Tax=Dendrothele bispora (strain CBS 962.96) TaxID=1314807 RepID=A0A4S8LCI2_DENBC|nr:hypothetical protein K435DRAFT_804947 [Dendrothele bispora CBS 962.96]